MPLVVGLTGGIGSGKSAAAEILRRFGVCIVDTDAIAHELTRAGSPLLDEIRTALGDACIGPDGSMNRAHVRHLVFSDPTAKARLEAILHPRIREETAQRAAACRGAYVVVVVPLLVETGGYRELLDRTVVVDCPEETQVSRTMARSGLSRAQVEAIMAQQATRTARLARADHIVDNGGDLDDLERQVAVLHRQLSDAARARDARNDAAS